MTVTRQATHENRHARANRLQARILNLELIAMQASKVVSARDCEAMNAAIRALKPLLADLAVHSLASAGRSP